MLVTHILELHSLLEQKISYNSREKSLPAVICSAISLCHPLRDKLQQTRPRKPNDWQITRFLRSINKSNHPASKNTLLTIAEREPTAEDTRIEQSSSCSTPLRQAPKIESKAAEVRNAGMRVIMLFQNPTSNNH